MPTTTFTRVARASAASLLVAATIHLFPDAVPNARAGANADDLIVTAARVPTRPTHVNVPVEMLSREDIERRQADNLADLLTGRPGIAVTRSGGRGALTQLRMRGAEAGHVLILIDGIDANDPALGSTVDLAHIDLVGSQRVEVLRGPQSALWGSDALAGVINIETVARPTATTGRISAESGSFGTHALRGSIEAGDGRAYAAASARLLRSDGINVAETGGDRDGYRNRTWHVNTGIDDERFSLGVVLRETDAEADYDPVPISVPVDGDRALHTRQRFARINGAVSLTPQTRQTLTVTALDTANENFADGNSSNSNAGRRIRAGLQNDWNFRHFDAAHRITLALERQQERFRQRAPATAFGDPNQDQSLHATSVVMEYDVDAGGNLGMTLSARADRNSDFDDAVAFRAAARYRYAASGTRLFVSAGTGVNNPTFTERYGFTPDTFIGNPNLEPERSVGVQLTLQQPFGERLSAELAVFRDWLLDEIDGFVFAPEQGAFTADNRDGRSHRRGIEINGRLDATDHLRISAGYGYLSATEPAGGGQVRELRRPRHTGRAVADLTARDGRMQLQVGSHYVGATQDNDFSTLPATRARLDGYWLVHVAARFHWSETWTLFGRIENALDADYQTVLGYRTPGRHGYIGVSANL